jgi:hypothetical protein
MRTSGAFCRTINDCRNQSSPLPKQASVRPLPVSLMNYVIGLAIVFFIIWLIRGNLKRDLFALLLRHRPTVRPSDTDRCLTKM